MVLIGYSHVYYPTAPEGCLQFFRGVSGTIRSYNFDLNTGQQLSNQDYTACIRQERNFCGIRYTACNDNRKLNMSHYVHSYIVCDTHVCTRLPEL